MRIVTEADSIRPGQLGPATGTIWIEVDGVPFPASGWNDFVVVILDAWVRSLAGLLASGKAGDRVHFMEGPYEVVMSRVAPDKIRVGCVKRPRGEIVAAAIGPLELAESLFAATQLVLEGCRQRDAWSADAARLEGALPMLRSAMKTALD